MKRLTDEEAIKIVDKVLWRHEHRMATYPFNSELEAVKECVKEAYLQGLNKQNKQ